MTSVNKITLEDRGQDFTEWYVRDGIVIDCQPFQGFVWVGSKVHLEGDRINVQTRFSNEFQQLNYRATEVALLQTEEAREVEQLGRKWAEMLDVTAESLGL